MKRILITGKNSYIGTSFEKWMRDNHPSYEIDTISVHGDAWREIDFSPYDVVFHVAGIAHADVGKVSASEQQKYYEVNRDLTYAVAKKFKEDSVLQDKVKQFIFMSSIIVYGDIAHVRKKVIITPSTVPNPANFYGDSKLQAENKLRELESDKFLLAILRPPMIYGPNSKGNYQMLRKIALKTPVFPDVPNERSMLHIDNLNQYVKKMVDESKSGIFFPQNEEYVRTSHLVQKIAKENGKDIKLFSFLNWGVYLLSFIPGKIGELTKKAFGNLVYEKDK
ncbi:NAD-dependent epimerase/dehydratase family protein [Vagococcus lutrae]|uniref:NAD-dependent epimerase/dehydratase family protein n=1 Tax=Vagococcus lutrae TaxID=81947 RepID=UPI00200F2BB9|nr:NAD-dependent epimerase/dehydratase family protein [Vagococcus lutrae]UQF71512.1 NAD-dependent epimerase/dehydratase family protein [Vagococcus lutrae]